MFVCLLSILTFIYLLNLSRWRLHIWHAYTTNDALSNDNKFNDVVTLTFVFIILVAFLDFVAAGGLMFYKHVYFSDILPAKSRFVKCVGVSACSLAPTNFKSLLWVR